MLDHWAKRELNGLVALEYQADPEASRGDVAHRVLNRLEGDDESYFFLKNALEEAGPLAVIEAIAGKYITGTRRSMGKAIRSGQGTDKSLSEILPLEAVRGVRLSIPIGAGRTRKKRAIDCTREEVEAAQQYYGEQRASMGQRFEWCGAIIDAFEAAELPENKTVADLYEAA